MESKQVIMKTNILSLLMVVFLSACGVMVPTKSATNTSESGSRKFPQISDVSRYSEVIDSFGASPLVKHFPEKIPPDASNVKFAYEPKMMQGAMVLELLMTLPPTQIDELWSQYSGLPKYQFIEDKTLKATPEPILFLIRDQNHQLNQQFSIFFIDAQPAGADDFPWNHGTMYGVGLNKIDLEVIYWLEFW